MMQDELFIWRLLLGWPVWRDSSDWPSLQACWHEDGYMVTTSGMATAKEFVTAAAAASKKGLDVQHFVGGISIEIENGRAIAQSKVILSQRAPVDGVICDAQCQGRFLDFLERREGRWGISLRLPIYERSRLDSVEPASINLDQQLLDRFPIGYRYLAYLQVKNGMSICTDLPEPRSRAADKILELSRLWLNGAAVEPHREAEVMQSRRINEETANSIASPPLS